MNTIGVILLVLQLNYWPCIVSFTNIISGVIIISVAVVIHWYGECLCYCIVLCYVILVLLF